MSNCMGSRKVKKMATGALVTKGKEDKKDKKDKEDKKPSPEYNVAKTMPSKKLADIADRLYRSSTGSQAEMQEVGSVTEPRTEKSRLIGRFGFGTSKADYGRSDLGKKPKTKATGGKIKGYAPGGSVKAKKGRRGDGICQRGRTKGRMV